MDLKSLDKYYKDNVGPHRRHMESKKQHVMPILDNIMNHVTMQDARFCNTAKLTGAFYQGNFLWTKAKDEFDYHVNLTGLGKWSWIPYEPRYYNLSWLDLQQDIDNILHSITKTDVPLPRPPAGHSSCRIGGQHAEWQDVVFQGDMIPYLVRRKFKELLVGAIRSLGQRGDIKLARKKDGPVLTLRIPVGEIGEEVRVNMIPIIPVGISFPDHMDWPRKNTRWPPEDKVARVKKIGIHFDATLPLYWGKIFEECEKELLVDIDSDGGCRKKAFRILEYLASQFEHDDTKQVLTSKHIKNLLLWECERHPDAEDWLQSKLGVRLRGMVLTLISQLQSSNIPQYWNPKVNMLDSSLERKLIQGVLDKVTTFSKNPLTLLK